MKILKSEQGFTLIELMIVVLIIGILVAVAVPVFGSASNKAKIRTCNANLRTLDGAIQTFRANSGIDPTSLTDLVPDYIKEIPNEPLGNTYSFVVATSVAAAYADCSDAAHAY